MLSKPEFNSKINNLPDLIYSKTGKASYTSFSLDDNNILHFVRLNTQKNWELDLDDLFEIYATEKFINTAVVKKIKNRKVNSPSVAVLMEIGCIDKIGNRL